MKAFGLACFLKYTAGISKVMNPLVILFIFLLLWSQNPCLETSRRIYAHKANGLLSVSKFHNVKDRLDLLKYQNY